MIWAASCLKPFREEASLSSSDPELPASLDRGGGGRGWQGGGGTNEHREDAKRRN